MAIEYKVVCDFCRSEVLEGQTCWQLEAVVNLGNGKFESTALIKPPGGPFKEVPPFLDAKAEKAIMCDPCMASLLSMTTVVIDPEGEVKDGE